MEAQTATRIRSDAALLKQVPLRAFPDLVQSAVDSTQQTHTRFLPKSPASVPVESPEDDSALQLPLQRKLIIGSDDDPLEAQADATAEAVVRPSATTVKSWPIHLHAPSSVYAPAIVHHVLRSPGQPLDPVTRSHMESGIGHDFSQVQVHTGQQAAESAQAVGARAYTVGKSIVFGAGEFSPQSPQGRTLIAHELAHTVQQSGQQSAQPILRRKPIDDPLDDVPPEEKYAARPLGTPKSQPQTEDPSARPGSAHEEHQIATFDVTPGNKRPWNLNQLTKTIVTELLAESRAYVRIFGAYPTIEGEEDPKEAAFSRADTVRRALIQWIGPNKFSDSRFDVAFASGQIGDPQIQVDIAYKGVIVSDPPITAGPAGMHSATSAPDADSEGDDLQSAVGGQWTWHMNRPGKVERSVQLQLTRGSGDVQSVYNFSVNLDTKDVQAMVGVQLQNESRTVSVLKSALKLKASVFLDLLGGITTAQGSASGSITLQIQGGAQVTATYGPITVALQAAPTLTFQAGQPIAIDFNLAPQGGMSALPKGNFPPFIGIPLIVGSF